MNNDDTWIPCRKPCRFLQERLFESPVAGIPAGMEEKCSNPVYDDIAQLQVLLILATDIINTEQGVFDGIMHENSYKLSRERIWNLGNLICKMREICRKAAIEGGDISQNHYFTKEQSNEG